MVRADQAVYFARERLLRAMAYYNEGRACEALGEPAAAQIAYAASLDLRDNREVRARLKHLAPAVLSPHGLAGPFVRPEDFCQAACEVERDVSLHWSGAAALTAPFRDAVKLDVEQPDGGYPLVGVALQLDDGWHVLPGIGEGVRGHGGFHSAELKMAGARYSQRQALRVATSQGVPSITATT